MSTARSGRGVADIDPVRLGLLNSGAIEAATLTECLAVDFAALFSVAIAGVSASAVDKMRQASGEGISRRMILAARLIHEQHGLAIMDDLRNHTSDTVRGWACFMVGTTENLPLPERLAAIRPFADDLHFGVREWAWMAVRPHIAADLDSAIALLAEWTDDPSERVRRFASEATRPRGVWCAHLKVLRQSPEKALSILEPLRADPSPYVQDSVGNWLNDASKDRPDWVRSVCGRWTSESASPTTSRICKRALRTINRKD